jgi:hypothetical protein
VAPPCTPAVPLAEMTLGSALPLPPSVVLLTVARMSTP